jgi:hypothetical protein
LTSRTTVDVPTKTTQVTWSDIADGLSLKKLELDLATAVSERFRGVNDSWRNRDEPDPL